MIRYYKIMAKKYNLSIITSIHQPNLEILMIFDSIYVLAKGGVCVFTGRPQDLRTHLNDCDITCDENQIPIEILLKIGANGYSDQTVIALSEKTNQELTKYDQILLQELKPCPQGIPKLRKTVSFEEVWYLLLRNITFTICYNWMNILFASMMVLFSAAYVVMHFDFKLEGYSPCIPKFNNCIQTSETIHQEMFIEYNLKFLLFSIAICTTIPLLLSSISAANGFKIIDKEFRNC